MISRVCSNWFLFFLMIRRTPRSTRTDTLFPYTTLFRSFAWARHGDPRSGTGTMHRALGLPEHAGCRAALYRCVPAMERGGRPLGPEVAGFARIWPAWHALRPGHMRCEGVRGQRDRKSTRLNSSH